MSECRPSFMHRSAYGVKRTEVFGNRREVLSWHEEYYPSAKRAWEDGSELYTLMPFGGEVSGQRSSRRLRCRFASRRLEAALGECGQMRKTGQNGVYQPGNAFRSLDAVSKKIPMNKPARSPYVRLRLWVQFRRPRSSSQ